MKTTEFNKKRKLQVNVEGELFTFNSYADLVDNFDGDVTNRETWANASNCCVFICNKYDRCGRIIEKFETDDEAENYTNKLNRYFAIDEEYDIEKV